MAQVSTNRKDDSRDNSKDDQLNKPTAQESGVSTDLLKKRIGDVYGSAAELVEGQEGDKYVAKIRSTSYGTGTFVIDGSGKSADEARTDLWNRIPRYKAAVDPDVLSEPHDYARPNGV